MILRHPPLSFRADEQRADVLTVGGTARELAAWAGHHTYGPLVRAHLHGDPTGVADLPRVLVTAGAVLLAVEEPIAVGETAGATDLARLALVRDAAGAGLPLRWQLADTADVLPLLSHLPPPVPNGRSALPTSWEAAHRFPLLLVRHGPGFASVKDVRSAQQAARYTLDDPSMLALVRTLAAPTPVATLPDEQRRHLDDLVGAGLAIIRSGCALFLPFRLRQWPIPSTAV